MLAGCTATVDTSLLRATGTSQISSLDSSTVRAEKLSKPQSNSRAVSEKLSTRVPPVSVLTSSQPMGIYASSVPRTPSAIITWQPVAYGV